MCVCVCMYVWWCRSVGVSVCLSVMKIKETGGLSQYFVVMTVSCFWDSHFNNILNNNIMYACYGSHVDHYSSLSLSLSFSLSLSLFLPLSLSHLLPSLSPLTHLSMVWPRCFRVNRVWSFLSVPWIPTMKTWWLMFFEWQLLSASSLMGTSQTTISCLHKCPCTMDLQMWKYLTAVRLHVHVCTCSLTA